ncbi:hypothetical protein [Streptomyces sp. NPDC051162]|uniref:hypothetical protein n=1 Tax=Streptomyces sp. NPDC051162 TaxID=3154747 RepID=UPI003448D0FF
MTTPHDGPADKRPAVRLFGHAEAEAEAARGAADEARGRVEEYDERGDQAAAEAAATDAAAYEAVGAEREMNAGELRAAAANSYSVTAPDGPAPTASTGAGARPTEAPRRTQTATQRPNAPRRTP